MSHQRMCNTAYWEYRKLFNDLCKALSEYSEEWKYIVDNYFKPKCELSGVCYEKNGCGRKSSAYADIDIDIDTDIKSVLNKMYLYNNKK